MKWVNLIFLSVGLVVASSSPAWGNPSMIPQYPGYQMHDDKDPITGQSVANDAGQSPLPYKLSVEEGAVYHDKQSVQSPLGYMSLESQGAGVLPRTKGYPNYKITPLVEAINPNN